MAPESTCVRLVGGLAISPFVVSRYTNRAAQLEIMQWPLLPNWSEIRKELRNKCVMLRLFWEEYGKRNLYGAYSYNHY